MRPKQQNNDHVETSMINPNTYNSLYGLAMQQSWQDLVLWEWFLNRVRARSLIELGTGSGAFSCFLLTQCLSRGLQFGTIDLREPQEAPLHEKLGLRSLFFQVDLLGMGAKEEVSQIMSGFPRPIILHCDNGDKPYEVALFSDLLYKNDYIGVHDFGVEFHDHNLDRIRDRIVEIVSPEEAIGNTRWFKFIKGVG